jgi:hypothetical protein
MDYTQAFPQALLNDPVYIRIPQGWFVKDGNIYQHENPKFNDNKFYMKLNCNLYGCKQAAWNWFHHLTKGLLRQGFIQSKTDSCLFLRKDCILAVYVDDCLIFSKSDDVINTLIKELSKEFLLQDEGDVNAFLGVQIKKDVTKKTITFTQWHLIQQILHNLGLHGTSNGKDTPADAILHQDVDGASRVEQWSYRSIIGKLNYLATNTRPDISMAVHQCAWFCSNPRAIHELAVKWIARYLLKTKEKGLVHHPSHMITLNMYVDADFAGRWIFEDNNACIVLATTETHFKPRTKHISLKFHHFHDHVRQGTVEIIKNWYQWESCRHFYETSR